MKKILVIVAILVFSASQVYLLYANGKLKHEVALKDKVLGEQATKYSAVQPQFALGVQNTGRIISDVISVEDSLKNSHALRDVVKGINLVCRISDRCCAQCVEHAVSILTGNKSAFDFTKVLFLSDCNSPRVFKLQIREYSLEDCNMFNCGNLGLPIEEIMFPYFMVIDSSLTVRAVYAPSKSTHGTDFDFKNVKMMYDSMVVNE